MLGVVQLGWWGGVSPWNTARMVRAGLGLPWARTIAGAEMIAAAARPPCMTMRRLNLAMVISLMRRGPPVLRRFPKVLAIKSLAGRGRNRPVSEDQAWARALVER